MRGTTTSHGRSAPQTRFTSQRPRCRPAQRRLPMRRRQPCRSTRCGVEHGDDQVADALTLRSVLPAEQRPCIRAVEQSLKEVPLVPEDDVDGVAVDGTAARRSRHQPRTQPRMIHTVIARSSIAASALMGAHGAISGLSLEHGVRRQVYSQSWKGQERSQKLQQIAVVHRLHEMSVEASFPRVAPVAFLSPAGQSATMTMALPHAWLRMRRQASIPLILGSPTSRSTTSGRRCSAASTAARPS